MPESLVALRDRREAVVARLSDAYAADLFEVEELERRLDLAHSARTVADLDKLIADLTIPAPTTALATIGPSAVDDPLRVSWKRLRVIMSSVERRGRWTCPKTLAVRTFWGNVELDFRDASLGPGITTINVRATMANVEIILPPNLAIDVDVSSFAGNVEERHRVPPDLDPARPMLRIVGKVRFGNLEISTRLPGESAGDERRRERAQRRELRDASKRALPPGRS